MQQKRSQKKEKKIKFEHTRLNVDSLIDLLKYGITTTKINKYEPVTSVDFYEYLTKIMRT